MALSARWWWIGSKTVIYSPHTPHNQTGLVGLLAARHRPTDADRVEGPSARNGHGLDAALANFGPDVVRLVLAPKRLDEGGKTLERLARRRLLERRRLAREQPSIARVPLIPNSHAAGHEGLVVAGTPPRRLDAEMAPLVPPPLRRP